MTYQQIKDITEEHQIHMEQDEFIRQACFENSEVIGWVLIYNKLTSEPMLYHIYQRVFDRATHEFINQPAIFRDENITGDAYTKELANMRHAMLLQD